MDRQVAGTAIVESDGAYRISNRRFEDRASAKLTRRQAMRLRLQPQYRCFLLVEVALA